MLSKNKTKYIQQLASKKQRLLKQEFVVEGKKLFEEAVINNWEVLEIYATVAYSEEISQSNLANKITVDIELVSIEDLKRTGNLVSNNSVIALVRIPSDTNQLPVIGTGVSLVLDNIKDPGNLGTILRTASWFGINSIFCSEETVDLYNPKVIQSSMGAIFTTKVIYTNLLSVLKTAKNQGITIFGADLSGEAPKVLNNQKNCLLVLGSESHGISSDLKPYVSKMISIPQAQSSTTESLNVAIANAILCYELSRT